MCELLNERLASSYLTCLCQPLHALQAKLFVLVQRYQNAVPRRSTEQTDFSAFVAEGRGRGFVMVQRRSSCLAWATALLLLVAPFSSFASPYTLFEHDAETLTPRSMLRPNSASRSVGTRDVNGTYAPTGNATTSRSVLYFPNWDICKQSRVQM